MADPPIHPVALGVVVKDGHTLLMAMPAWLMPSQPWRAIGGFVEYRERAADAVVHEWREELDRGVEVVRLLTVAEHIYDVGEQSGHELTFYFELRFAPGEEPPDLEPLQLIGEDWPEDRQRMEAHWVPIADLRSGKQAVSTVHFLELVAPVLAG
jgi:ADP-ribose pyrophosphatase YjhB (NUDIX family)